MNFPAQDIGPDLQEAPEPNENAKSIWQRMPGMMLLAFLGATLVFVVSLGADILMLRNHEPARITIELSDAISSLVIGLLGYKLIRSYYDRREHLRKRLQVIADMNHHVRNALQIISLTAHGKDKEEISAIRESVNRIQWALRELLPRI